MSRARKALRCLEQCAKHAKAGQNSPAAAGKGRFLSFDQPVTARWRSTVSESHQEAHWARFGLHRRSTPSTHSFMTLSRSQQQSSGNGHAEGSRDRQAEGSASETAEHSGEGGEIDASKEELVALVAEKDGALEEKDKLITAVQDKLLRALAEMENLRERTKREAENTRKFAIQGFAKDLLDMADNFARAIEAVPEEFRQGDGDETEAAKILKSLLGGVQMTERQLQQAFKKHGLERYDPTSEQFDPNLHQAMFEVPDPSKEPGTVAVTTKAGYMLQGRVIRPAEVGVVKATRET